jgi:IS30 family transposase
MINWTTTLKSIAHEEVDHEWIQEVETEVNGRPRRMHGYRTPAEVAEGRSCPAI